MSLYARSDLMSVSVPVLSGGCGDTHVRPVTKGVPAKIWKLTCYPCESYLRGDAKPKVIKVIPGDKEQGIPSRMEHVQDSHPQWSNTPEGIPPTPDEQHVNKIRSERGSQQLGQLQALAALKAAGLEIPDEAMWLLEQNFDKRVIKGKVICPDGHDNVTGARFCSTCGKGMDPNAEIVVPEDEEEKVPLDIYKLSQKSLREMCKEHGLAVTGTKDVLCKRLQDAGVS